MSFTTLIVWDCHDKIRYRIVHYCIMLINDENYYIGFVNTYGWKIIDIQCFCNNRFYTFEQTKKLHDNYSKKIKKRQKNINNIKKVFNFLSNI